MSSHHKPDIIWILVDGVRPDKLRSCGNLNRPNLFIDDVLTKGTLFTTVISAGANTKTSMHASFTSLYPSINKMNAYDYKLITKLDPMAVTLTDILRHSGYKTFRYQDVVNWQGIVDIEQSIPHSGFDKWESSGYRYIGDTPNHSFSTSKRDAFIANFNQASGPKFAYIHLWTSHDINIERGNSWTSAVYEKNLFEIDKDFEDVWNKLQITNSTFVVVSTDHGARLDIKDRILEEQQYGMKLRDISMNTFYSFIGCNIPKQRIDRMVRTIDTAPTILEIAGCEPIFGQGKSLVPLIKGEKSPEIFAFMETGGIYQTPSCVDGSDIWGVRTEKWKYWRHAWKGEWLIDLENDPREEINLIRKGLLMEDKLRRLVKEYMWDKRTPEQVYAENAKTRGISKYFTKRQIVPEVSLFLLVQDKKPHLDDVIDSILAQICVYFELTVVDTTPDGSAKAIVERYQDYRMKYHHVRPNTPLISIFNEARGKYISCFSPDVIYEPYFLYELRNILRDKFEIALVYSDYIYIDQIGLEKVVNAENMFNKKNNIGYCFLARKEAISNPPDSGIKIFNNDDLYLPLIKDSLISYSSQKLGDRNYRAGIYTLVLHILYKVIDVRRKEGVGVVVRGGTNFLKTSLGNRLFLKNKYDAHYDDMRRYVYLPHFISFLKPFILREKLSVLDIGCGKGDFLLEFKKKNDVVLHGIDIDPEKVGSLEKTLVNARIADAHSLPFDDNTFDLTISFQTIHILASPEKACKEMERVTKNGGLIFIGYSDQNNYINRLYWKGWSQLKQINDDILKSYFSESVLIKRRLIKFIDLYTLLANKVKISLPFPKVFDILSVFLSKFLKKDKYIAYRYLLFKKRSERL